MMKGLKRISVLAVLPVLLLTSCFFGGTVIVPTYEQAERYASGGFEYAAAEVTELRVIWYNGSVELTHTDGERLCVRESGGESLPAEKALHWLLEDGVLTVQFCRSGYTGRFSGKDKKLTVEVPERIKISVETTSAGISAELGAQRSVSLESTSGTIEVTSVTAEEALALRTTSGAIRTEALEAERLLAKTTSGSIRIERVTVAEQAELQSTSGSITVEEVVAVNGTVEAGSNSGKVRLKTVQAEHLSVETTSGDVTLDLNVCKQVSVQTTSGSVRVDLAQSLGATVRAQSTSGRFRGSGYRTEGEGYIWGNGDCRIDIRTTSGGITVE